MATRPKADIYHITLAKLCKLKDKQNNNKEAKESRKHKILLMYA